MRPWWWRPARDEDDGERTLGAPGPGKVLMVTARDPAGDPIERTWVEADAVDGYDETRWSNTPP